MKVPLILLSICSMSLLSCGNQGAQAQGSPAPAEVKTAEAQPPISEPAPMPQEEIRITPDPRLIQDLRDLTDAHEKLLEKSDYLMKRSTQTLNAMREFLQIPSVSQLNTEELSKTLGRMKDVSQEIGEEIELFHALAYEQLDLENRYIKLKETYRNYCKENPKNCEGNPSGISLVEAIERGQDTELNIFRCAKLDELAQVACDLAQAKVKVRDQLRTGLLLDLKNLGDVFNRAYSAFSKALDSLGK